MTRPAATCLIWLALCLGVLAACTSRSTTAQSAPLAPITGIRSVMVEGTERRYQYRIPARRVPGQLFPVIIALHGGGGNPESMALLSGLNAKADAAGFVLVYPYGSGPDPNRGLSFNGGLCCASAMFQNVNDVGFIRLLIDDLAELAPINLQQVYATGMSNGGIMAHRLAAELSDRIAAIAAVGGPLMLDHIAAPRPVPIMHIHGTADAFAPYGGGFGIGLSGAPGVTSFRSVAQTMDVWRAHNRCSGEARITDLPDAVDDGMRSRVHTWSQCAKGAEVVLVEVMGGGHTWPGMSPLVASLGPSTRDFSANDLMWSFFSRHELRAPPEAIGREGSGRR